MHMQLGVSYHIPKGASKNGLPVKETFNPALQFNQNFAHCSKHICFVMIGSRHTLILRKLCVFGIF